MEINALDTLSPLDGRYARHTKELSDYFSEWALMSYRIEVEAQYLIALSEHPLVGVREFSDQEKEQVRLLGSLSLQDAAMIKAIETEGYGDIKATNQDVKAVEYYMKERLKGTSLEDSLEWIHFALTSEDVNNAAYSSMLRDALCSIILPAVEKLYETISELADKYSDVPMLARTHGQPASPTTFGKEMRVFSSRIDRQITQLEEAEIMVKLNGATGNYNAHVAAYPDVDWLKFTEDFVERLNGLNPSALIELKPNLVTTQIEPHDSYAEIFDNLARLNKVILGFNQDMWRYISDGWVVQKPVEGEVGSSTMPHKVNPIDFENSEGNLGMANDNLRHLSDKLQVSRLQRDLSDSTVQRNIGVALAYSLIAYKSALNGLSKIFLNEEKVVSELEERPEIIAEGIQTILRREGVQMPYEKLKELTRGRKVTLDDFRDFIEGMDLYPDVKDELLKITPTNYTGIAQLIARNH